MIRSSIRRRIGNCLALCMATVIVGGHAWSSADSVRAESVEEKVLQVYELGDYELTLYADQEGWLTLSAGGTSVRLISQDYEQVSAGESHSLQISEVADGQWDVYDEQNRVVYKLFVTNNVFSIYTIPKDEM